MHDQSKVLDIKSSIGSYRVFVNSSLINFEFLDSHIVIADERFQELAILNKVPTIFVEATEGNKSLESCAKILGELHDLGADKGTEIVAVGGGVLQDLATLVASLYMRGLNWTYFPTTQMSQFDSCIGGKSSINLSGKKNIVGNIYPPHEIHIDFSFNETLSEASRASGYLEAIKISFARGRNEFYDHLQAAGGYADIENIDNFKLNALVLDHKRYFIEIDEFDQGIRQMLNFGHTFGHAIEATSNYSVQHGLSIGLGMLMALEHPEATRNEETEKLGIGIRNILNFSGKQSIEKFISIHEDKFVEAFRADKKHVHGNCTIILPDTDGLRRHTALWNSEYQNLLVGLLAKIKNQVINEIQ